MKIKVPTFEVNKTNYYQDIVKKKKKRQKDRWELKVGSELYYKEIL